MTTTFGTVLPLIFGERSTSAAALDLILLLSFNFLIFAWCFFDAYERGRPLNKAWRYGFVIGGHLAFFTYLFKSRGFTGEVVAVGYYLLVLVGISIAAVTLGIGAVIIMELLKHTR